MAPTGHRQESGGGQEGLSPTESAVVEIWRGTLGVESLGADDEFFAFGADSVVASRMLSQVSQTLSVDVPLSVIFEFPRLRDFCEQVDVIRENPPEGADDEIV